MTSKCILGLQATDLRPKTVVFLLLNAGADCAAGGNNNNNNNNNNTKIILSPCGAFQGQ